jgi:hypothetical protein
VQSSSGSPPPRLGDSTQPVHPSQVADLQYSVTPPRTARLSQTSQEPSPPPPPLGSAWAPLLAAIVATINTEVLKSAMVDLYCDLLATSIPRRPVAPKPVATSRRSRGHGGRDWPDRKRPCPAGPGSLRGGGWFGLMPRRCASAMGRPPTPPRYWRNSLSSRSKTRVSTVTYCLQTHEKCVVPTISTRSKCPSDAPRRVPLVLTRPRQDQPTRPASLGRPGSGYFGPANPADQQPERSMDSATRSRRASPRRALPGELGVAIFTERLLPVLARPWTTDLRPTPPTQSRRDSSRGCYPSPPATRRPRYPSPPCCPSPRTRRLRLMEEAGGCPTATARARVRRTYAALAEAQRGRQTRRPFGRATLRLRPTRSPWSDGRWVR